MAHHLLWAILVVAIVLIVIVLVLMFVHTPRSRWWQAYQNRRHANDPGPGGPKFP